MAQQTTTVPSKTTGDELTASELNSINNVVNANSADAESRLTSLEGFAVAIIEDQKPIGTNGGTFTSGAWQIRDLNTIVSDLDSIVSLSSNQCTLQAGTYLIESSAPAYSVDKNKSALYNVTNATYDAYSGSANYANSGSAVSDSTFIKTVLTLGVANTFEIRHRSNNTRSTDGFGLETSTATHETYTQVLITKLG